MIKETIEIDGISVDFAASASLPRVYRNLFGRDFFTDYELVTNQHDTEACENIAYCMAFHANNGIEKIDKWLEQFSTFAIFLAMPGIFSLLARNNAQTSEAKNA